MKASFLVQFAVFTLLYALLIARIAWEFAVLRYCRQTSSANRHSVMLTVLVGCVVRLAYVDVVDIAPSTPLEVEFVLRAAKPVLLLLCGFFVC